MYDPKKLDSDVNNAMKVKAPARAPLNPQLMDARKRFFQSKLDDANQSANRAREQGQDALTRRFTALGASGSGAAIAAMANNNEQAEELRRKAVNDVAGQELQVQEADLARDFQGGMADRDVEFKQGLSNVEQANRLKQIDLAERQFALDKDVTAFNMRMAEIDAGLDGKRGPMTQLAVDAINPFGSPLDVIGDAKYVVNPVASVVNEASKFLTRASPTLICTELHRQGFISDHLLELDGKFGKEFREENSEAYKGYLIFATPVVEKMRKSKWFSKLIAFIFVPWCRWMANRYDKSIPYSYRGEIVYHLMHFLMPKLYKFKIVKGFLWT